MGRQVGTSVRPAAGRIAAPASGCLLRPPDGLRPVRQPRGTPPLRGSPSGRPRGRPLRRLLPGLQGGFRGGARRAGVSVGRQPENLPAARLYGGRGGPPARRLPPLAPPLPR